MSGLEILGVAAGILQIAEIGSRLSIKLYTFYGKIKHADQRMQSLSSEVALTSNVLRQLGDNLQQDEQARLYSNEALSTTQEVLQECRTVFEKIGNTIQCSAEQSSAKSRLRQAARKVGFMMDEQDLDALRSSLERLKTTMLLLLNVIMYAGQLRSRAELGALGEQRALIQELVEQRATERQSAAPVTSHTAGNTQLDSDGISVDALPVELTTYCSLIQRIISDLNACQAGLEQGQHTRIRNDIVKIHSAEIDQSEIRHGHRVAQTLRDRLASLYNEEEDTLKENVMDTSDATRVKRQAISCVSNPSESAASMQESLDSDECCNTPLLRPQVIYYGLKGPTPPPFAVDDSLQTHNSEQNRPDMAEYERSHKLRTCSIDSPPARTKRPLVAPTIEYQPEVNRRRPPDSPYDVSASTGQSPTTSQAPPVDDRIPYKLPLQVNGEAVTGPYKCYHPGCTAPPFLTQYMLDSHAKVHSQDRPYFCRVEGCPRGPGGRGFKRRREMIRHGRVHDSPRYKCPFCPDQQHYYPRPSNLLRHVRVHHADKSADDPVLSQVRSQVLSERPNVRRRRRRSETPGGRTTLQSNSEGNFRPENRALRTDYPPQPKTDPLNDVDLLVLSWTTIGKDELDMHYPQKRVQEEVP